MRKAFWEDLSTRVKNGLSSPVCIGDFNDIMEEEENVGGKRVIAKSNLFLRDFMFEVRAIDIGFTGRPFTWCNKRGGQTNIRE